MDVTLRRGTNGSPVGTPDVTLATWSWGADGVHSDAVLGLELVTEVTISVVLAFVSKNGDGSVVDPGRGRGRGQGVGEASGEVGVETIRDATEVRGGEGSSGQADEEYLKGRNVKWESDRHI